MKPDTESLPGMTAARRQLLATITRDEAAEGARAWREHASGCRAIGMTPTPFSNWLAEWLECVRADQQRPLPENPPDEGRHERRDFWKPFRGLGEGKD